MPCTKSTLPLLLTGRETLEQLCQKIRNLTKFQGNLDLTSEGRTLCSVCDLRTNDTIVAVGRGLLGGMENETTAANPGKKLTNEPSQTIAVEDIFAAFIVDTDINPDVPGLPYEPIEGGSDEPPVILKSEIEEITV